MRGAPGGCLGPTPRTAVKDDSGVTRTGLLWAPGRGRREHAGEAGQRTLWRGAIEARRASLWKSSMGHHAATASTFELRTKAVRLGRQASDANLSRSQLAGPAGAHDIREPNVRRTSVGIAPPDERCPSRVSDPRRACGARKSAPRTGPQPISTWSSLITPHGGGIPNGHACTVASWPRNRRSP